MSSFFGFVLFPFACCCYVSWGLTNFQEAIHMKFWDTEQCKDIIEAETVQRNYWSQNYRTTAVLVDSSISPQNNVDDFVKFTMLRASWSSCQMGMTSLSPELLAVHTQVELFVLHEHTPPRALWNQKRVSEQVFSLDVWGNCQGTVLIDIVSIFLSIIMHMAYQVPSCHILFVMIPLC